MTLKEISAAYGVDAALLKQYFQAFVNLYGICPLQQAFQIINHQNPEAKLSREQFLGFADNYPGRWKIVSPNMVYSNVPETRPMRRELVRKSLLCNGSYRIYDKIRTYQGNKDFYIPEKDELLRYAQEEYYEATRYTAAMAALLALKLKVDNWPEKLSTICTQMRFEDFSIQQFIDTIDTVFHDKKTVSDAIACFVDLQNNTRLATNRGYTPSELSEKENLKGIMPKAITFGPGLQALLRSNEIDAEKLKADASAMSLPPELVQSICSETDRSMQKVGRNDPCPCGSGKKYKKCCGR